MRRLRNLHERTGAPSAKAPEKFTLNIELGNEAMQTGEDVARALRAVAKKLDGGADSGRVQDENGNTVGEWDLG
jgi:hypothetical protein